MSLYRNTLNGYKYLKWSRTETFCYLLRRITEKAKICPSYFEKLYHQSRLNTLNRFLDKGNNCFDFNGARIPNISDSGEKLVALRAIFEDVLLILCHYNENYSKELVRHLDEMMIEGPYGYVDENVDVRVKEGDIVIDAGAWIGDFSAYSAVKNATCYAFEPTKETYDLLCETKELNNTKGKIIPVRYGLGDTNTSLNIVKYDDNTMSNKIMQADHNNNDEGDIIKVVTLDSFVETNGIEKVDFIKSDIEGFERNLLMGATNVMKKFAPKLAICTYHLPDDPEVLESIIKKANPDYNVVHLKHKLFASV